MRKLLLLLAVTAAAAVAFTTSASADYGPGTQYQVEISANSLTGGNFWFWAALGPGQASDYQNTDCIHTAAGGNPQSGPNGAGHSSGELTSWSKHDGMIEMDGVKLVGGLATGNYFILDQPHSSWFEVVVTSDPLHLLPPFPLIFSGRGTQVQVAP
jgi:hypothetical protein